MSGIHVAVSGVSGFIGAHVAQNLLQKGYHVHGTVRRDTPEKIQHLNNPSTPYPGTLQIFEADLLIPGSFDETLKGCTYAIHVASPYVMNVRNPQRDLVDPAVNGTIGFLTAAKKAGVKKVVLTSSFAAVQAGGITGKIFSEEDWNTTSSLKSLPYFYSKTVAEKAAWDFVKDTDIKLIVINPVAVFGPSLTNSINETVSILIHVVNGGFFGIVDLSMCTVDVRDVAEAHIRAMESETASGRYICCNNDYMLSVRELTEIAQQLGFRPPTKDLTSSILTQLIKMSSYISPGGTSGQFVRSNLGNAPKANSGKINRDLGMTFREPKEYIKETYLDLVKWRHLPQPKQ